ncbi:MAG: hypothetical protein WCX64_05240, partial [Candidatus Micrarchaeia archaeon]
MDGRTGVLIAAGAIILVIIIAVAAQSGTDTGISGTPNGQITKEMCENAKGNWNECSSACRNLGPDQSCIQVCGQECECGGFAGFGCPEGYACMDYFPNNETPDAMGVCRKR